MTRHEYHVSASLFVPSGHALEGGFESRIPVAQDREALADLMMDAYVGTVDYEGESVDQALEEVDRYLSAEAYLEVSRLAVGDGVIGSAVLMSRLAGEPLVGYVMTRAALKGQGLASALLDEATAAVWATGADGLRAFITAGNGPSESIFLKAGYRVIASYGD